MGSMTRSASLMAALVCGALFGATTLAQEEPLQGNPERGQVLSYTCLGCHGIPNYKNAYPNYRVPKLEGQHPAYLAAALQAYKTGERSHTTMHSQASSLSAQDIADIAAYFAGQPVQPEDVQPVGKAPEAAQTCVACHGENGVGITDQYPTLAGQHDDYLQHALTQYKRGGRKNAIMATFAQQLSDEQIEQLAEYFSRQGPGLRRFSGPAHTAGR